MAEAEDVYYICIPSATGVHGIHTYMISATCGSKLTPAPYEKAQTSEEMIYMQAVRSSRQLSTEVLHAHECVLSEQ